MTNINPLHVSALGCHPQGFFHIKGNKRRPRWNDSNIKIRKDMKLKSIKLQSCGVKIL
jgi:hypothetical protein